MIARDLLFFFSLYVCCADLLLRNQNQFFFSSFQAREAQGRREIARLLEQRRVHASESMEHEEASLLETRTRMEQQLQSRDENITKLGARCAELQSKMERAVRDQRTATSEREVSVNIIWNFFFFSNS